MHPCPFCGDEVEPTPVRQFEAWRVVHMCKVLPFVSVEFASKAALVREWNTRAESE